MMHAVVYSRPHPSLLAQMEKTLVALRERLGKQQTQVAELKSKYGLQEGNGR